MTSAPPAPRSITLGFGTDAAGARLLPVPMRVDLVDPPAYTPAYDHALAAALAAEGVRPTLVTSRFGYGPVPEARGYAVDERFYRLQLGPPGSRLRRAVRLAQHLPDMLAYRAAAHRRADLVHLQWLTWQPLDVHLLPRGRRATLLTAHDILPREPRRGQRGAQRRLLERVDGVVVHSEHGRERLTGELGLDPGQVHVVPHGAFEHLTAVPGEQPLPSELGAVSDECPVVLCFGLLRPYKGLDVLLEAWRGIERAELWIVGRPRMDTAALRAAAPPGVRWHLRFVPDAQVAAFFRRADVVVLPYREIDQSGVLSIALAFARPMVLSAVGGFPEVARTGAAALVAPGDPAALHARLRALLADAAERERLSAAARAAATGIYAWGSVARRTLALYREMAGP